MTITDEKLAEAWAENAELVRENKRLDREWEAAESTASTLSKRVEELEGALRKAREFIVNGTEFGFSQA